jgi:hypothetical protein
MYIFHSTRHPSMEWVSFALLCFTPSESHSVHADSTIAYWIDESSLWSDSNPF